MSTQPGRLAATLRQSEQVTPLELFFDLVFVLALTQCTALMADVPTWQGIAQGILILGILWWAWVGYAWLTSVVDPEEGVVRLAIFAAMAALLVIALCVPEAFGDLGLLFAMGYLVVRVAHIVLFFAASRDDPALRRSVVGLSVGTAVGTTLLVIASQVDDGAQAALWALSLGLDVLVPLLYGSEGWKLVPHHFAERHGLIMIIALGESIVAIGVGAEAGVDAAVVVAAIVGVGVSCALWWLYFDVVALVAARRLANAQPGREQNEIARDSFSLLHFPMVAGIVLVALGMKKTLQHTDEALEPETASALFGGTTAYLLAHVAFRWRNVHRFSWQRLAAGVVLLALIPVGTEVAALWSLALVLAVLLAVIAYERVRFAELRERMRHQAAGHEGPAA